MVQLRVVLILIIPNLAYGSAFLPKVGKYKIIASIEQKQFMQIKANHGSGNKNYNFHQEVNFNFNIERGISEKISLSYNLETTQTSAYKFFTQNMKTKKIEWASSEKHGYFPKKFASNTLGVKYKLYDYNMNAISYGTSFKQMYGRKYSIENRILFGKTFKKRGNNSNFIGIEFGYVNPITYGEESANFNFNVGIWGKKKKLYIFEIIHYYRVNYFDPITKTKYPEQAHHSELKLQVSVVKQLKKGIFLQQGTYYLPC